MVCPSMERKLGCAPNSGDVLYVVFCSWTHLQLAPGSVILVPRLSDGLTSNLFLATCLRSVIPHCVIRRGLTSPEMLTALCSWEYFYGTLWAGTCLSKPAWKCSPWGPRLTAGFVLPPVLLCRRKVSTRLHFSMWYQREQWWVGGRARAGVPLAPGSTRLHKFINIINVKRINWVHFLFQAPTYNRHNLPANTNEKQAQEILIRRQHSLKQSCRKGNSLPWGGQVPVL